MRMKKGFTLIELLVVISIIALLLSILMPGLGKAKKIAQQVVCLTNLRAQGTSFTTYAIDNNDSFVTGHGGWAPGTQPPSGWGYWMADLKPYRGEDIKSLICPSAKKPNPNYDNDPFNFNITVEGGWIKHSAVWPWGMEGLTNTSGKLNEPIPMSYTISRWATNPASGSEASTGTVNGLTRPVQFYWRKTANVTQASSVPLVGDGRWLGAAPLSPSTDRTLGLSPGVIIPEDTEEEARTMRGGDTLYHWGMGQFAIPRHTSGTNMGFADNSARKVDLTELWKQKWYAKFDAQNDYATGISEFPDWITKSR
jgi:prepilin-type N-terminal cleavage/methylation domain-containing protein